MQEDTYYSKYLESKTGNSEREINITSITDLREDIAQIKKVVAEKVLDGISQKEIKKIKWSSVTIALNEKLSNFNEIVKILSEKDIPIHETFGSSNAPKPPFKVAIGDGFDIDQIKDIVNTLSIKYAGWISYAEDETETGQFNNVVLIGAYGSYERGIKFDQLQPILERKDLTILELYKLLGK